MKEGEEEEEEESSEEEEELSPEEQGMHVNLCIVLLISWPFVLNFDRLLTFCTSVS